MSEYDENTGNEKDPKKYHFDSAYTMPANEVPQSRTPVIPENNVRKVRWPHKTRCIILMSVLAALILAGLVFSILYKIDIVSDGGSISMHIYKRGISYGSNSGEDGGDSGDNGGQTEDNQDSGDTENMNHSPPKSWGGASLPVNEAPPTGAERLSIQQIYKKCVPSVVSITCSSNDSSHQIIGSGIIMSQDGYIITNTNVIDGAMSISVCLYNGEAYTAEKVGEDSASGFAVIKISESGLTPAEFANSDNITVGDNVISIGNPVNSSFTVTNGIISSSSNTVTYRGYAISVFQTNAACASGCSGSPVINEYGQVTGILNTDISDYYGLDDLYFAVPVNTAKPIIDELILHGYISGRPDLGMELVDIPLSAAAYYGMPLGVLVDSVSEKSDAYTKGISKGDVIVSINGKSVASVSKINEILNSFSVGDSVTLGVYRKRQVYSVTVTILDSAVINSDSN